MTKQTKNSIIAAFGLIMFLFGLLYLSFQIGFTNGMSRERNSSVCVGVNDLGTYQNTLSVAQEVCINYFNQMDGQYNGLKNNCEMEIKRLKKEIYLLKQVDAISTSTENIIN